MCNWREQWLVQLRWVLRLHCLRLQWHSARHHPCSDSELCLCKMIQASSHNISPEIYTPHPRSSLFACCCYFSRLKKCNMMDRADLEAIIFWEFLGLSWVARWLRYVLSIAKCSRREWCWTVLKHCKLSHVRYC